MYYNEQEERAEHEANAGAQAQAEAEMLETIQTTEEVEKIVSAFNTRFAVTNDSDSKELSLYQRKLMNAFLRQSFYKPLEELKNLKEFVSELKDDRENHKIVFGETPGYRDFIKKLKRFGLEDKTLCMECSKPVDTEDSALNCHDTCRLEL